MKPWLGASVALFCAWLVGMGCGAADSHDGSGKSGGGGSGAHGGTSTGGAGSGGRGGSAGNPDEPGGMGGVGGTETTGGTGAGGAGTGTGGTAGSDAGGAGGEADAGEGGGGGVGGEVEPPDCVLATDGVLDWDVKPARLTGALKLNGAVTGISPRGEFWLVEPETGDEALLGDTYQSTYSAAVLPKTYDLVYRFTATTLPTTTLGARHTNRVVRRRVAITGSGTLDANLDTFTVSGNVTVGGQPYTSTGGSIWLTSTTSSDEVLLHSFPSSSSYAALVAPGSYDVFYRSTPQHTAGTGPVNNTNAKVMSAVTISGDRTLDIDVPMITLSGWLSVNGARTSSGTGVVMLRRAGGDSAVLGSPGSGGRYSARVVPGTYDVYFGGGSTDQVGRVNQNARLSGPVSLEQSRTDFDIDVPVVTSGATITIDGSVVPSTDYGNRVVLRPPNDAVYGPRDQAGIAFLQQTSFPAPVYIVPGVYDVHLQNLNAGGVSGIVGPLRNRDVRVAAALDLTTMGRVAFDVPVVTLTGATTTAPSPSGGIIVLASRSQPGDFADLAIAGNGAYTARVVPGRYDVVYENRLVYSWEPDVARARNAHRVLRRDVDLTSAGAATLDVPVRAQSLHGAIRLDGQFAVASHSGQIVLRSTDGTDSAYLAAVTASQYTAWVFPGRYDVYFVNTSPTTTTPLVRNANARLGCVVVPDGP
jgi:hypothetical protein